MFSEDTKNLFVNSGYDNQTNFQCPNCNSDYVHQERIEIFDGGENRAKNIHVVVNNGEVTVNTDMFNNPSSRRQGLTIFFRCENCSKTSMLHFSQHKGCTLVDAQVESVIEILSPSQSVEG